MRIARACHKGAHVRPRRVTMLSEAPLGSIPTALGFAETLLQWLDRVAVS